MCVCVLGWGVYVYTHIYTSVYICVCPRVGWGSRAPRHCLGCCSGNSQGGSHNNSETSSVAAHKAPDPTKPPHAPSATSRGARKSGRAPHRHVQLVEAAREAVPPLDRARNQPPAHRRAGALAVGAQAAGDLGQELPGGEARPRQGGAVRCNSMQCNVV
jgi:hypothetical protein